MNRISRKLPALAFAFTAALAALGVSGCRPEEAGDQQRVEALIQEELKKRVEDYRLVVMQQCRERALLKASSLADSILITEARLSRDTLGRPPKPIKPEKPEIKLPKDSLPVQPLLPGRKDSLN